MSADPPGEIPSDEEFAASVIAARERKGWTQSQLAAHVNTSQPTISAIEAGKASAKIPDVCRVLKIPGPMFGWAEPQKDWANLGHELERRSPALFKLTLQNLRQVLAELPPEQPDDKSPPSDAPKQKAKPLASANITGIDRGSRTRLREPDELPSEKKKR